MYINFTKRTPENAKNVSEFACVLIGPYTVLDSVYDYFTGTHEH